MRSNPAKRTPLASLREEDWEKAREAYFLEHVPGLEEYHAAQESALCQIEDEALVRYPDPTPDDIAAAEAALPYSKRTEAQLRRSFEPLAVQLPKEVRTKRKRFAQREQ